MLVTKSYWLASRWYVGGVWKAFLHTSFTQQYLEPRHSEGQAGAEPPINPWWFFLAFSGGVNKHQSGISLGLQVNFSLLPQDDADDI